MVGRLTGPRRLLWLGLLGGPAVTVPWLLIGVAATSSRVRGVLPVVLIPLGSLVTWTLGSAGTSLTARLRGR